MPAKALAAVTLVCLLAGCAGPEGAPGGEDDPGRTDAPRAGRGVADQRLIVSVDGTAGAIAADVLCTFGGGIELPRTGGRVLAGTTHLEVFVNASVSSSGIQLGHVLDRSPGYDEVEQENITWLPVVLPNGQGTFTVEVPPQGVEALDDEELWHFYLRSNVPEPADQSCYTGLYVGEPTIKVIAR